ncbi:MAG: 16S rRNA (guanine(527)-N(7))-methyltransferase RsmG [Bryobacteraceae bacterium]|jgi:16S rRNA (guanine527-N7)-methyltransferase
MSTWVSAVFRDLLRERLRGIAELTDAQAEALESHYELMVRWNRTLNLTTIRDLPEVIERHYGESLYLAARLPAGKLRIVDVGSGAGFPGLPVAVYRPDCVVTLIESHQRKAVFLKEAARELTNVRVLARRAEQVAGQANEKNNEFDLAVSRAVSYHDLIPCLRVLAPAADLLGGTESPPDAMGFEWEAPVPLPWGKQRYLRMGRRS